MLAKLLNGKYKSAKKYTMSLRVEVTKLQIRSFFFLIECEALPQEMRETPNVWLSKATAVAPQTLLIYLTAQQVIFQQNADFPHQLPLQHVF